MAKEENKNKNEKAKDKPKKEKVLTIADVFEAEGTKGGTRKELAEKMIVKLKAAGINKTSKGNDIEKSVPKQINAMMAEVGKKGRWAKFKNVGEGDKVKLQNTSI